MQRCPRQVNASEWLPGDSGTARHRRRRNEGEMWLWNKVSASFTDCNAAIQVYPPEPAINPQHRQPEKFSLPPKHGCLDAFEPFTRRYQGAIIQVAGPWRKPCPDFSHVRNPLPARKESLAYLLLFDLDERYGIRSFILPTERIEP